MGVNNNPGFGESFAIIRGRPAEHEAVIFRQGQLTRILQARKCACISGGKSKLGCPLCHGKGYRFSFQSEMEVQEEISRHCNDCEDGNKAKIFPWITPVTRVIRVQRFLSKHQGGNVDYPVLYFDDTSITVDTTGHELKDYYQVKVSYAYRVANPVIGENCIHVTGSFTIHCIPSTVEWKYFDTSNPLRSGGDISKVTRARNVTQNYNYKILGFAKQSIYLDPEDGVAPAPLETDVLEVDYDWVPPVKVVTGRIDKEYAVQKWGEDIKMGDLEATLPGGWNIGRGDIFTFLTTLLKGQDIIIRGAESHDEIAQFDVYDILENIEDEDGVKYTPADFELQNYNDIFWKTAHKPSAGKRYSVMYRYNPSYTIYKRSTSQLNAEDKLFPTNLYIRLIQKLDLNDIEVSPL